MTTANKQTEWKMKSYGRDTWIVTNDVAICKMVRGTPEANTRLIAACPQMYEALKVAKDALRTLLYAHPTDEIGKLQMEIIDKVMAEVEVK